MHYSTRPFDPDNDVVGIRDFFATLVGRIGQDRVLHTGDWLWRLFLREDRVVAARDDLRTWTDDGGRIVGFCWFTPPGEIEIQVDLAASPDGGIERAMVEWALTRQRTNPEWTTADLVTDAFEHDGRKIAILADLGFGVSGDGVYNLFWQSLDGAEAAVVLPAGNSIRSVDGDSDISDRVAIHREVWHPSRFTEASYRAVRESPGYRPDLDLVAVAPDGRFAAYTICWYDPVNRIGEFEPVGTRADFRRQGYGRAVIAEGLRRLRRLGATGAMVASSATNEASNGLYEACGFVITGRYLGFRRPPDPT